MSRVTFEEEIDQTIRNVINSLRDKGIEVDLAYDFAIGDPTAGAKILAQGVANGIDVAQLFPG